MKKTRKEKIKQDVKKLKNKKMSFKGEYSGKKPENPRYVAVKVTIEPPKYTATGRLVKQKELPFHNLPRAKPTLEQLSEVAAVTLQSLRRDLEKSAQKEYEAHKFLEVKRLAQEQGLTVKLIIATIDPKEEIKVKP